METRNPCRIGFNTTTSSTQSWPVRLVLFVLMTSYFSNVASSPVRDYKRALEYLPQYGYLKAVAGGQKSETIINEQVWRDAVAEFQEFSGLNVTGEIDEETNQLMSLPRCGVADKSTLGSRVKRYSIHGSKWRTKNLTYKISQYSRFLDPGVVDVVIQNAFNVWSKYTDLHFIQVRRGRANINIRFVRGPHGDGKPFDGPQGTLAHAFFPAYGGSVHFDDSERWSTGAYKEPNLFQVAAHEIGHSLGIEHSRVRAALMTPFYMGYNPSFRLHQDDIRAIQRLYGRKSPLYRRYLY